MKKPVPIPDLMHPEKRRESGLTWAEFVRAAIELARRYERAHAKRQIVGGANLGVGADGSIEEVDASRKLDLDAPETKGRGGIHAPEENQDAFGLALQAFAILFGHHPFIGINPDGSIPDAHEAIARRAYVHARGSQTRVSEWVAKPSIAGDDVAELFERALAGDPETSTRPTAREWVEALESLEDSIVTCVAPNRHRHRYSRHLGRCPWCALIDRGAIDPFLMPTPKVEASEADAGKAKAMIETVISDCERIARRRTAWPDLPLDEPVEGTKQDQDPVAKATERNDVDEERERMIDAAMAAERRDRLQALALSGALAIATVATGALLDGPLRLIAAPLAILTAATYYVLTAHGSAQALFAKIEVLDSQSAEPQVARRTLDDDEADEILAVLEKEASHAIGRLNACRKRWDELRIAASNIDNDLKRRATELKDKAAAVEKAIADAPWQARRKARLASTTRYLHGKKVSDATIPQIDVGTKTTLALHGISSAQDVLEKDLVTIPGVGHGRDGALRAWAEELRLRAPWTDTDWPRRVAPVIATAQSQAMELKDASDGLARIASERDSTMRRSQESLVKKAADALASKRSAMERAAQLGLELEEAKAPPEHKPIRIAASPTPWRRPKRWRRRWR